MSAIPPTLHCLLRVYLAHVTLLPSHHSPGAMHGHAQRHAPKHKLCFLSLLLVGVQMRLVCGSSEQMAQLINAGTLRQDSHIDRCFTFGVNPLLAC